jgi:two-component system CheB/CheR fusion protein
MFPVQVDLRGLGAALDDLAATTSRLTSATVSFTEVGEVLVSETETAMHLYRIAQEAVSNAIKHGRADHIAICLSMEDGVLRLTIDDDGKGFFVQPGDTGGMGLRTMAYRARSIGASLEICERDEPGTRVLCEMPIPHAPPMEEPS